LQFSLYWHISCSFCSHILWYERAHIMVDGYGSPTSTASPANTCLHTLLNVHDTYWSTN
jgi:hypothetical protein